MSAKWIKLMIGILLWCKRNEMLWDVLLSLQGGNSNTWRQAASHCTLVDYV